MDTKIEDQSYFLQITQLIKEEEVETFDSDTDIVDIIDQLLVKNLSPNGFYIVDLTKIIQQYTKWINYLPRVKPYYAVKCNPDRNILNTLKILGTGFDCASVNEIIEVRNIADEDEDIPIIYANPAKSDFDLKYARSRDIDLMTFDCEEDIWGIKRFHEGADLILRIKVDDKGSICRFNSKFGAKVNRVSNILEKAKSADLNVVGVSFHVGSGCRDVTAYSRAIQQSAEVFKIAKEIGYTFNILDIGGGFPGVDTNTENGVNFQRIAEEINNALDIYFPIENGVKIIAEPGRYFSAASHTLVLSIIKKKREYDDETGEEIFEYTLTDGVYGSFNCNIFDHAQPMILPFNERDGKTYKSVVFGPTCDSMDTISIDCQLPSLLPGEWVYIENFGAYTTAAASTFNGFPKIPSKYIIRM